MAALGPSLDLARRLASCRGQPRGHSGPSRVRKALTSVSSFTGARGFGGCSLLHHACRARGSLSDLDRGRIGGADASAGQEGPRHDHHAGRSGCLANPAPG